jgi:hypothetical protein
MSRIFYVSHDVTEPRGGVAVMYDHVATLRQHGLEAFVVHATPGFRYRFAGNDIPVLDSSAQGALSTSDVLVVPEDYPSAIRTCRDLPCRKVLICQNHYYLFNSLKPGEHWRDFGFSAYLCVSSPIQHALKEWFDVDASVVRPAVDGAFFGDGLKPLTQPISVACMPRKGLPHIRLVQGLLATAGSKLSWLEIDGLPKEQVVARLRDAQIYVSTSVAEGLGLPPLEAMAAGCLVVGFAGGGGLDYATADNGVWVPDQDPWALADALCETIASLGDTNAVASLDAKRRAGRATAENYTRARFERDLLAFWSAFLSNA